MIFQDKMLPSKHIIFGFLFSLLLLWIYPEFDFLGVAIIFLSSILIDFDHYVYYAIKHKDFSLRNAYRQFIKDRNIFLKLSPQEREKMERALIIFHGIECWLLLVLLMLLHYLFGFILIGFLVHMILDFIDMYIHKMPYAIYTSKLSQWYLHKRNKKLKELVET